MITIIRVAESLIKMHPDWTVRRLDIQGYGADSVEGYIGYLDIEHIGTIRIRDNGAFMEMQEGMI